MKRSLFFVVKWGALVVGLYAAFVVVNLLFLYPYPWSFEKFSFLAGAVLVCWGAFYGFSRLV